jgi:hypothetical protein
VYILEKDLKMNFFFCMKKIIMVNVAFLKHLTKYHNQFNDHHDSNLIINAIWLVVYVDNMLIMYGLHIVRVYQTIYIYIYIYSYSN